MPEQPTIVCETCGSTKTRIPGSTESHAKFKDRRFCSQECKHQREGRPLLERLMDKVNQDADNGCWLWTAAKSNGYGVIGLGSRSAKNIPAHVASYELHVGPVPTGMVLDHLCRTPACVNPDHLEPVTAAENSRRGARAKITADQANEIRRLVEQGKTQALVASIYNLHAAHVSRIVNRHRWQDKTKPVLRTQRVAP